MRKAASPKQKLATIALGVDHVEVLLANSSRLSCPRLWDDAVDDLPHDLL